MRLATPLEADRLLPNSEMAHNTVTEFPAILSDLSEPVIDAAIERACGLARKRGPVVAVARVGGNTSRSGSGKTWWREFAGVTAFGMFGPSDIDLLIVYDGGLQRDGDLEFESDRMRSVYENQIDEWLSSAPDQATLAFLDPGFLSLEYVRALAASILEGRDELQRLSRMLRPTNGRYFDDPTDAYSFAGMAADRTLTNRRHGARLTSLLVGEPVALEGASLIAELTDMFSDAYLLGEIAEMRGHHIGCSKYKDRVLQGGRSEALTPLQYGTILPHHDGIFEAFVTHHGLESGSLAGDDFAACLEAAKPYETLMTNRRVNQHWGLGDRSPNTLSFAVAEAMFERVRYRSNQDQFDEWRRGEDRARDVVALRWFWPGIA